MRDDRLSGPDGATFLGVVANGDDKIEMHILEFRPGLAAGLGSINMVILFENTKNDGIDMTARIGPGAERFKTTRPMRRMRYSPRMDRAELPVQRKRILKGVVVMDYFRVEDLIFLA